MAQASSLSKLGPWLRAPQVLAAVWKLFSPPEPVTASCSEKGPRAGQGQCRASCSGLLFASSRASCPLPQPCHMLTSQPLGTKVGVGGGRGRHGHKGSTSLNSRANHRWPQYRGANLLATSTGAGCMDAGPAGELPGDTQQLLPGRTTGLANSDDLNTTPLSTLPLHKKRPESKQQKP